METHSIRHWIARGIQQLVRLVRVVIVNRHISVVRPTLRRQNAARRFRLSAPQVFDHRPPIEGVGDRLPHSHVFQNRIAQIKSQILASLGSGRMLDLKIGIMRQSKYGVRRK